MTIRVLQQDDGKWYAYHAHIVYNGDPMSVDFDSNDNTTVEVMAALPHGSFLSMLVAQPEGMPATQPMIAVYCPDPNCGSVSYYPANGDPDARAVHARFKTDPAQRVSFDPNDAAAIKSAVTPLNAFVANAWARADLGMDPMGGHGHLGAMVDGVARRVVAANAPEIATLTQRAAQAKAALQTA